MAIGNVLEIVFLLCLFYAQNSPAKFIAMAQFAGVIQLTNSTTSEYKLTNTTAGRVVYNQTIHLPSIESFTTHFRFRMKNYSVSYDDYGGSGIAFFMIRKEGAYMNQSDYYYYGLPPNGPLLFPDMVAISFNSWSNSVQTITSNRGRIPYLNWTQLQQDLIEGGLWNAWIDYNIITQNLEVFAWRGSNGSKSQNTRVLSHFLNSSQYLPEYIVVGLSASAEESSETHTLISWSFDSKTRSRKRVKTPKKLIIIALVGFFVCSAAAVMIIWGYFSIMRKKRPGSISRQTCEDNDMEVDKLLDHSPRRFRFDDLKSGTNNFSDTQKLGQGGFGGVYRGTLLGTNEMVAVKRISEESKQGMKEFISEVSIVSRLRHRNLVQLLGWCHERGQLLLVYEYMPNGSLDKHLFSKGDHQMLHWSFRYEIAREIASGLLYLHEEWDQCVVHRDIKSSNVLLDCNFNAKLGDFGLARLLEHNRPSQTTNAAGTVGYLAPECVIMGRTSPESDVYSFGAVALEIASGRRAVDVTLADHNMRLVEWLWDLYGKDMELDGADKRLQGEFEREEMKRLMVAGLWCSNPDPAARPKMRQVLEMLNVEAPLPQLPLAMPVPSYTPLQEANLSVDSSFMSGR